ncbi:MAG: alpha/beta hydrolase [Pseudomonadota bacterium]
MTGVFIIAVSLAALAALFVSSFFLADAAEKAAPPLGRTVSVDGQEIHVLELGPTESDKPPVVLIHGASANLRDMKIALGDALAEERRVILIDRPGRGYSTRPPGGYRLDVQARYIKGAVDALGVERPVVIGQSFGGGVALSYALQYQDEMSGLFLFAPVSHEWPGGIAWYNSASNTPVLGFILRRLIIPSYGLLVARRGADEAFSPEPAPQDYVARSGLSLLFRPAAFKANAEDIAHLKSEIVKQQDKYASLSLPLGIATGDADTTVSPTIHSKTLAQEVPGAVLTILPDVGHASHHGRAALVKAFLADL